MRRRRIGYVRVISFGQNPERQVGVQALRDAGYAERQPVAPPTAAQSALTYDFPFREVTPITPWFLVANPVPTVGLRRLVN